MHTAIEQTIIAFPSLFHPKPDKYTPANTNKLQNAIVLKILA